MTTARWLLLCLLTSLGCGSGERGASAPANEPTSLLPLPPPASTGGFTDVTEAAGITVRHRLPTPDIHNIVDSVGAGAAFVDLDSDGWLDLVVAPGPRSPEARETSGGDGLRVYRNRGDGRFEDATAHSGIPADLGGVAVAAGDVDGDGDRDLYVVDRGPNRLYLNRGDGRFEEATQRAAVGDARFGVGAVFFDMDGDEDLDLYVTNYLDYDARQTAFFAPDAFPGPLSYRAEADVLYRNRGDGTFEDVSESSGVASLAGRGMSLAAADFDDDGDSDVFVANDATANFLLVNDGQGRFSEAGLFAGVGYGENGDETSAMASDVGDVDGDGRLDLVVSDTAFGALYLQLEPGLFVDEVMPSGLGLLCGQYTSWGQNLLDYDNDGDLDIFVANGGLHHLVGWEDLLLRNSAGRFEDASSEAGPHFTAQRVGRSSITGDYDNDGDVDVFVTHLNGAHVLLRNDLPAGQAWLTIDLAGARVRDVTGARVEIRYGDERLVAESRIRSAYLGQSDSRLHFGLGPGVERLESVRVRWPDGRLETIEDVATRQVLRLGAAGDRRVSAR